MQERGLLQSAFGLALLGFVLTVPAVAQKITGDISGTVLDRTGAAVQGATITATNIATNETRSAKTSDTGLFRILELPPGKYKVTAMTEGFKSPTREAEVGIALVTQSDFRLEPGQVSQTVEVQDVVPLVETSEDRLSTLFGDRQVADLPNNGRDFNNLLDGVPGVQRSPGGGFQSLNINGQRATSNNFAVDGIPNNDRYYGEPSLGQAAISGTAAALIPLDGISEFNVQSNPGVEFGVKGGSVINIGLKGGTNDFHGNLFWDRHTDAFDARNWFASSVTPFRLNQFGASGGGPIKKDKAFFFLSFQGFHLKDKFPSRVTLPSAAEIADATACVTTGANPNTVGDPNPASCFQGDLPGPGPDQIFDTADDGQVSTLGQNLLSFIPLAPSSGEKVDITANNALDVSNFHVKVDYALTQSQRISVKYLFGDSLQSQPPAPGVPGSVGPLATGPDMWNSIAPSRAQLAGINYTWTISPTKVLESRFGYQRFSQRIGVNNNIDPNDLGLNTGPLGAGASDTENLGVPSLYYLGYFGASGYSVVGGIQGYPIVTRPDASYDWQEHFTAIKGNHTIKIGGQYQDAYTKSRRDRARTALSFYYHGNYLDYYATDNTHFESARVAALNELLLGVTDDAARSFGVTNRHIFQKSLGLYIQDSWKVKPSFTLEVGVRWDVAGALGERDNLGANFLPDSPKADPDGETKGFVGLSKQPLYGVDKNNFGPRIGFAWNMFKSGKTVLRGGYSLNYDLPNFGALHAPQNYFNSFSGTRSGFFTQRAQGEFPVDITSTPEENLMTFSNNPLCLEHICMGTGVDIFGASSASTPPPPFNVVQVIPGFQTPMNHAYNVTVEQSLTAKTALSVAFVGTAGRDLLNWRDLNACPVSTLACDTSRQPFGATFPDYDHILQLNNDGYSDYNSFQLAYKVRDLHGLTGQFNFVRSKSKDTGSANRGGDFLSNYQNPYSVSKNYAPSNFDTPWNVNFTIVYDVPRFARVPKLVGEGWSVNSIFRAQEGRPFTVYSSKGFDNSDLSQCTDPNDITTCPTTSDPSGQGLKTTYVNYDGSPLNYDFHNTEQFFNTSAFSLPVIGTIGNAGRNSLRQPGIAQWDVGIFKKFQFNERYSMKFKWELFNALNH